MTKQTKKTKRSTPRGGKQIDDSHKILQNGTLYNTKYNRKLTPSLDSDNYQVVHLSTGLKRVHKLLAEAYLGPAPSDKPLVIFKDQNRNNITPNNLQYGTHADCWKRRKQKEKENKQ
jgi:hypothetical protein